MMDPMDGRLAELLAVPDRAPDIGFVNLVALRVAAERKLAARLAAERGRTATLLVSTLSLAIGLWLFAQGSAFAEAFEAMGGGTVSLAAVAAVMLLWLGTAGAGALSSE